ncbi:MAG: BspA family leucine-rich repeat surface protein [Chitinophagales bacterium]|nr:BspA family leucine-rich repeat surface protein [Chitinophagales bacterium]
MKKTLLLLSCYLHFVHAQNIYYTGMGNGSVSSCFAQADNSSLAIYLSGTDDGFAIACLAQADNIALAIYQSGIDDGFANACLAQADNIALAIYQSGTDDGFANACLAQADNIALAIYQSGIDDGFANACIAQADNIALAIYQSGIDDGFANACLAQADNIALTIYNSGIDDGFANACLAQADNIALAIYKSGIDNGFANACLAQADNIALDIYQSGTDDGFANACLAQADNIALAIYNSGIDDGFEESCIESYITNPFKIKIYTEGDGFLANTITNNTSFNIPINNDGTLVYDYHVDWDNDGNYDQYHISSSITHNYSAIDTQIINIYGDFPSILFGGTAFTDKSKLMAILNWGDITWKDFTNSFRSCKKLKVLAKDAPILDSVLSLQNMFALCDSFNDPLNHWNLSSIKNIQGMFFGCSNFNQDLNDWDVSEVENFGFTFYAANKFNGDISAWNTSSMQSAWRSFYNATSFNGDLSNWDVGNVSWFNGMFEGATSFNQNLSSWNIGENLMDTTINMELMFNQATSFDQNLGAWDISKATNMTMMLSNSGLSPQNYDNTLIAWVSQNVQDSVHLGSHSLQYCLGESARNQLINQNGWIILGDSLNCDGELLPVELLYFAATWNKNSYVELNWRTATEINNAGFEVQHSLDALNWQKIAWLDGHGNSNEIHKYYAPHYTPSPGNNYYRLKQLDYDGSYAYSNIESIYLKKERELSIQVYPNPTKQFLFIETLAFPVKIEIRDILGNVLETMVLEKRESKIDLQNLSSGIYYIQLGELNIPVVKI